MNVNLLSKGAYEAPMCETVEMKGSSFICQSGNFPIEYWGEDTGENLGC